MPKHKFKSPNGAAKKKKCESACTLNTELSNNIDKYKVSFYVHYHIYMINIKLRNILSP